MLLLRKRKKKNREQDKKEDKVSSQPGKKKKKKSFQKIHKPDQGQERLVDVHTALTARLNVLDLVLFRQILRSERQHFLLIRQISRRFENAEEKGSNPR